MLRSRLLPSAGGGISSMECVFSSPYATKRGHFNVTYIFVLTLPFPLLEVINLLTNCRLKIEVRAKGDKLGNRVTQTLFGCLAVSLYQS